MTPLHITLLAQSDSDLLRTMKEPGFAQWFVYLLVFLMVVDRLTAFVNRDKPKKTEVSGSVETQEKQTFADAKEVEKLRVDLESLRTENASQHEAALRAGATRVTNLSEVMDRETSEITTKVDALQKTITERLDDGFEKLHEKINKIALQTAGHARDIPHIDEKVDALTQRYNEAIPKLHSRIDDAIKGKARS